MHDEMRDICVSEVLGALSAALDMTEGQPEGHCLRCCHIGMAIGRELSLSESDLDDLYYAILLKDLGCSSNAARICALYLTDDHAFKRAFKKVDGSLPQLLVFALAHGGVHAGMVKRLRILFRGLRTSDEAARALTKVRCERGAEIATKLHFEGRVADAIRNLDERWDGRGLPAGRKGEEIPPLSQIALLAQVCEIFYADHGRKLARHEILSRRGTWFAPRIVDAFAAVSRDASFWDGIGSVGLDAGIPPREPGMMPRRLDDRHLDDIVTAFSLVIDAKSPYTGGHSKRVAALADAIARELHYTDRRRRWLRRAAHLHDIGKLGISSAILEKSTALTLEEYDSIKAHPAIAKNILSRVAAFKDLLQVVGDHHEKLDGRGYPRGLTGGQIGMDTRIVTVADIFEALTADRPYRASLAAEAGLKLLEGLSRTEIDPVCVTALRAALRRSPSLSRPDAPLPV